MELEFYIPYPNQRNKYRLQDLATLRLKEEKSLPEEFKRKASKQFELYIKYVPEEILDFYTNIQIRVSRLQLNEGTIDYFVTFVLILFKEIKSLNFNIHLIFVKNLKDTSKNSVTFINYKAPFAERYLMIERPYGNSKPTINHKKYFDNFLKVLNND